jgi:hypothetical protein
MTPHSPFRNAYEASASAAVKGPKDYFPAARICPYSDDALAIANKTVRPLVP